MVSGDNTQGRDTRGVPSLLQVISTEAKEPNVSHGSLSVVILRMFPAVAEGDNFNACPEQLLACVCRGGLVLREGPKP